MREQLQQILLLINSTEKGEKREQLIQAAFGLVAISFAELVNAQKDAARALEELSKQSALTNQHLEALTMTANEGLIVQQGVRER